MASFNRGNRGGGFGRRDFRDRGSKGFVTMHKAVCDNCGKECEVPFRPTSGKPVYCSNCFEKNRGSDSERSAGRNFERPRFEDKQMFDATCDECGNSCQVPFRPSGDKPVYCSNCFGDKKNTESRNTEPAPSQPQYKEQFESLNAKLDKILNILELIVSEVAKETALEEIESPAEPEEIELKVEKKAKKSPKKKAT